MSFDPYKIPFGGFLFDPYLVARIFRIQDPIIFQALKKILRFGRKHKTLKEDIREAITSLEAWERMEAQAESMAQPQLPFAEAPKVINGHVLITPETCKACKNPSYFPPHREQCMVCDGGLGVCINCGKAEAELDTPCEKA